MIVGSFGGYPFGINRATYDIDILVDLHEKDFEALSEKFPLPRYYADPEMMRNSIEMGIMFNIIDTGEGVKADLVPLRREPEYRLAFDRRTSPCLSPPQERNLKPGWHNLRISSSGSCKRGMRARSDKHPNDIHSMLVFDLSGFSDLKIEYEMISSKAAKIGN